MTLNRRKLLRYGTVGVLLVILSALFTVTLFLVYSEAFRVRTDQLPIEAQQTLNLIKQCGPFPHAKDGAIFNNYEKRLPVRAQGYYHEYTVATPGGESRGARRIIAGSGPDNDICTSGEYYYTFDHYQSFKRIQD